jgi:hypothetical protein
MSKDSIILRKTQLPTEPKTPRILILDSHWGSLKASVAFNFCLLLSRNNQLDSQLSVTCSLAVLAQGLEWQNSNSHFSCLSDSNLSNICVPSSMAFMMASAGETSGKFAWTQLARNWFFTILWSFYHNDFKVL